MSMRPNFNVDKEVTVSLDKRGRIVILCPYWLNHQVRRMGARFSRAQGHWTAPLLRGTITSLEGFSKAYPDVKFNYSPDVIAAISEYAGRLKVDEEAFPAGFRFKTMPMPHQKSALDFVWPRKAAALGSDLGTGKTKVVIDIAVARFLATQITQFVVLCPAAIQSTWEEELDKHSPIKWAPIHRARENELPVLITSIEGLGISTKKFDEVSSYLTRPDVKTMITCDESSFIKEQSALRSQRAHLLGGACDYRVIMNGTLVNNSPLDLWSQYQFIDPNIIGQEWFDFRSRHAIMGGFKGRQILEVRGVDEVIETVAPWTLIVKKSDVMKDLPPKTYQHREIKPNARQIALFKELGKKPLKVELPEEEFGQGASIKAEMVLERVLRSRQIAAGFVSYRTEGEDVIRIRRLESSPKTDELMYQLEQVTGKVVIWCTFTEEIAMIKDRIAAVYGADSVVVFDGKTPDEERDLARHRLQEDPRCRFFVGNVAAGAVGITLTAASTEIYHSNSFSYYRRAQSEDRCHRKGQINSVTIIDLIVRGSADELCYEAISEKCDMAEYVMNAIHESRLKQLGLL